MMMAISLICAVICTSGSTEGRTPSMIATKRFRRRTAPWLN